MGIEELRFTNHQVNTEFEKVCKEVGEFLESKLNPNHKG